MHAVVVTVSIDPEHMNEAAEQLLSTVVPGVKQLPGLISGYWFAPIDSHGLSVTLFETEQAAQAAADGIPNRPTPDYVKFDTIDVREVIAQV